MCESPWACARNFALAVITCEFRVCPCRDAHGVFAWGCAGVYLRVIFAPAIFRARNRGRPTFRVRGLSRAWDLRVTSRPSLARRRTHMSRWRMCVRVRPHTPACTLVYAHTRPDTPTHSCMGAHTYPRSPTLMPMCGNPCRGRVAARGEPDRAPMCGIVILRVGAGLSIAHVAAQHRTDGQEVGAPAIAHNASAATPTTRRDGQECRP